MDTVNDIAAKLAAIEPDADGMSELTGAQFVCTRPWILREPNADYIRREIEWYESMSRYVDDIPGETPAIWKQVASNRGKINSNYGWCIYSGDNGYQFDRVVRELNHNPMSRRAVMYYTHPDMHTRQNEDGMNDHMCTTHVQYLIRDGFLQTHVYMRSNDAVFGFNNDYAWQNRVTHLVANLMDMEVAVAPIVWNVGSLHVYPRHQSLLEKLR
tara:strand:+ start:3980 stop:4618 length:639 start_codon:yes stop_codon:yes gene_type:complete